MLSKKQLLAAARKKYMDPQQLAWFEQLLLEEKRETQADIERQRQWLANPPEFNDEADRAQYEDESRVVLRLMDRQRKLLPKIDEALRRIRNGSYGYCLETGEPIGIERLLIRPTAEFCADVKNTNEAKEKFYAK